MDQDKQEKRKDLAPGKITLSQWICLGIILLLSFGLRVYRVGDISAGFYCDEASIGYNAYCLGGWGIDDSGERFPLYIKSFGVQKNPVFVYSAIIPIKLFGLSEFSVRLTSVVFGTLTVLGTFWLVYEYWGAFAGLIAAFLLSVLPWNFHFSRIAFELISMPCLFVFGYAFLVRALRKGRWNWLGAGFLLGISLHTYVMITTFLPPFLFLFFLLFLPNIWRQKWFCLLGLLLFSLIALPAVRFQLKTQDSLHFRASTWFQEAKDLSLKEKADKYWDHYKKFYSEDFLFKYGDSNPRHSVKNHGEIYRTFIPLVILGVLFSVLPPRRLNIMLLWWLALFPAGAALTNETFATRSIMGCPLAPIFSAYSFSRVWFYIKRIKWRWLRWPIHFILGLALLLSIGYESFKYFKIYFLDYNKMSASGVYGFQFGYRDIIKYMEENRDQYPQKLLTASYVNNPEIFVNFYTKIDPTVWLKTFKNGYSIIRACHFSKYEINQPTLFALREFELNFFDDYEIKKKIIDPNGRAEFVVADIRKRKTFLMNWSVIGLFDCERNVSINLPYPEPYKTINDVQNGLSGIIHWRKMNNDFTLLEFNEFYRSAHPRFPGNPEECYANAVTYVNFPSNTECIMEYFGTNDYLVIWINGRCVLKPVELTEYKLNKLNITFVQGWNEIAFRTCEGAGEWYLSIALTDLNGKTFTNLEQSHIPPQGFKLPVETE
ncbi:MAG: hypothetical protein A2161_02605 [Candidatus Schekmanbacteria bacterium RBG_13_48_7]|uniref:Glycosyltransferase RgtA/B/C/D-like domain-containing protein n=1 Tax=Candidatus Schekmanbacteria bacterium RBG_13_48_7 TaxID=1817878 RepID=A0A1F7S2Q0_9BACT|nr:MAG: hypothetical protein A2161_02605 [Candidatus Schekmanbacteria bacterium RBG_13_48_7]